MKIVIPGNEINDFNVSQDDHLICKKCSLEAFKKENMIKFQKQKSANFPLQCNICEISHQYSLKNFSKMSKSQGGCCVIF